MVEFISFESKPFLLFHKYLCEANEKGQKHVDAMCISSIDNVQKIPKARFVNLKYVKDSKLIFFSNYNSNKSLQFEKLPHVSCTFFWTATNVQVRISGGIEKTSPQFSDMHFQKRSREKNALAISSNQSSKISSYDDVKKKYSDVLKNTKIYNRPSYWGGFSVTPYYFEFWQGRENRLNKREEFLLKNNEWVYSILEP
jgi:pyridoxamine 5'-phosphate oxidase